LADAKGAGLFLDNATATLSGNSYADNAVDLVSQGADCAAPPEGYEGETLSWAELCPAYDYATCGDEFALYMTLSDPESGHARGVLRPLSPGLGALHLPTRPAARPRAIEATTILPREELLEPAEYRPPPLDRPLPARRFMPTAD